MYLKTHIHFDLIDNVEYVVYALYSRILCSQNYLSRTLWLRAQVVFKSTKIENSNLFSLLFFRLLSKKKYLNFILLYSWMLSTRKRIINSVVLENLTCTTSQKFRYSSIYTFLDSFVISRNKFGYLSKTFETSESIIASWFLERIKQYNFAK
jgi:hypothetical protein